MHAVAFKSQIDAGCWVVGQINPCMRKPWRAVMLTTFSVVGSNEMFIDWSPKKIAGAGLEAGTKLEAARQKHQHRSTLNIGVAKA